MEGPPGWHEMKFDIRRSVRYHSRRRAFFDRLDMLTNMAGLVFGSAAVYGVLSVDYQSVALGAAALVTVLSSVNLVVGSSQRARVHNDLAKRFIELERHMSGGEASAERLAKIEQERLAIEAEEPPVLRVLDCLCHNEEMRAQGYPKEQLLTIGPIQRLLAHVMDLGEHKIHPPQQI